MTDHETYNLRQMSRESEMLKCCFDYTAWHIKPGNMWRSRFAYAGQ